MDFAMSNTSLTGSDFFAISGYFVSLLLLGYLTRRNKTFAEFALGRQALPALMVFASLAATIIGPGFSLGFTEKGYTAGFLFFFLCLSYPLQTIISGLFLAPRLARLRDCTTLGDVMNKRYGKVTQFLTGIISVGLLIGFTAIMGKIGGTMLHAVTGWPVLLCYALITGSTALLTFTGGVRATVATEAFQFSLFSVIVPVLVLLAFWKNPIPVAEVSAKAWALTAEGFSITSTPALLGIVVSFFLGEMLLPPYANRALAAQSEKSASTGFVLAGGYTIVWLGLVCVLGILAHAFLPVDTAPADAFLAMGKSLLPSGVYGLLLAAIIAVIVSSQEATLNSGAVAFVKDIVAPLDPPTEKRAILLGNGATLGIAALSIYVAQFAPSIIDGLLILYSLWAPTILVPLIGALYGWRATPASGWLSILLGGSVTLVWQVQLSEFAGIPAILVGLGASLAGFFLGRFIKPSRSAALLKEPLP